MLINSTRNLQHYYPVFLEVKNAVPTQRTQFGRASVVHQLVQALQNGEDKQREKATVCTSSSLHFFFFFSMQLLHFSRIELRSTFPPAKIKRPCSFSLCLVALPGRCASVDAVASAGIHARKLNSISYEKPICSVTWKPKRELHVPVDFVLECTLPRTSFDPPS